MQEFRQNKFQRNVGTTFTAQVLSAILAIINAAIVARALGVEGKGTLSLLLLVPHMLGLFLGAGIGLANVYYVGTQRLDVSTLTQNSVGFAIVATIFGIILVGAGAFSGGLTWVLPNIPAPLVYVALIGFPVALLGGYLNSVLHGLQRIATLNLLTIIQSAATLLLNVVLVVGFKLQLIGALIASLSTSAVNLSIVIVLLHRLGGRFRPAWNPLVIRTTLSYGLRGYVGNILQFFNYRLDMFIINYFLGSSGAGLYSVSVAIAELLWYLPNAVGFVILPKAAASEARDMNRFTPRVFGITLALTALGGVGIAVLGQPFIRLIYSSDFLPAYTPLLALLPGVVLLGSAKVLTNEIAGRGYPHYNSINSALALVVTIGLDMLLIPRYGVLGAAIASSAAYTLIFVTAVIFYSSVSRRSSEKA